MLNENYCDNLEDFKNKNEEFEIYEIKGKKLNIKDLKIKYKEIKNSNG